MDKIGMWILVIMLLTVLIDIYTKGKIKSGIGFFFVLAPRIIRSALVIGSLMLAVGFAGPLIVSTANLGPLLGIFITGPVGTLAGALLTIVRARKDANDLELRGLLIWLFVLWSLTMLYTLFMIGFATQWAYPAIVLQWLIIVSTAFFIFRADTSTRLPEPVKRSGPVAVAALAMVMLMTVFPPVIRPWWGPKTGLESADANIPLPKFAFILDERFDASRHIPLYAVDRHTLVVEWLMAISATLGISFAITGASGRSRPDDRI